MTNTALNKDSDQENIIYKEELIDLLYKHGIDYHTVLSKISDVVSFVIDKLINKNPGTSCFNCFELFGIDILITDKGEIYLLEINENPVFKISSQRKYEAYRNVFEKLINKLN